MAYVRTTWVAGLAPGVSADKLNNIEAGIEQNNLFNILLTVGKYKVTEFNIDGSITESIKLTIDDSTYATLITEFDEPALGNITQTLECTDLEINTKVVTVFDSPNLGDITETSTEVV